MSKLVLFFLVLVVAFGGAYALGSAVDPDAGDGGTDARFAPGAQDEPHGEAGRGH